MEALRRTPDYLQPSLQVKLSDVGQDCLAIGSFKAGSLLCSVLKIFPSVDRTIAYGDLPTAAERLGSNAIAFNNKP